MSLHADAITVYRHLTQLVSSQHVTTYGAVSSDTGVHMGPEGHYMTQVLYHLFRLCDERKIPPITAVVSAKPIQPTTMAATATLAADI